MDPVGGESGREDRDGNHEPAEASGVGVSEHEAAIGGGVCAADFDGLTFATGLIEGGDEVVEKVVDGDGLDAGVYPFGADHDGESFGKVSNHLEGYAAGADDNGGAELGDGDAAFAKSLASMLAGAQVGGEIGLRVAESAEIDDALDACVPGGFAEVACGFEV